MRDRYVSDEADMCRTAEEKGKGLKGGGGEGAVVNGGVGVNHAALFSEVKGPRAGGQWCFGKRGEMDLKLITLLEISGLDGRT